MKRLILLLSCSLLFSKDISGTYIVTSIIKNGKTKHPNTEVTFKSDGKYYMMGAPFGEWKSGRGNIVYINSAFEPKFEKFTILDSQDRVVLQNSNGKMVYKKVYSKKSNNRAIFLLGSWEYIGRNGNEKITFSKPDNFKCIEQNRAENSTTKGSGKWLYSNKSVTVTAFGCSLNGKFRVKKESSYLIIGNKRYKRVK